MQSLNSMKNKILKIGQAMTGPFKFEIFDSHNTSYFMTPEQGYAGKDIVYAVLYAKRRSNEDAHKVVIHDSLGHWQEYEKGELKSWNQDEY